MNGVYWWIPLVIFTAGQVGALLWFLASLGQKVQHARDDMAELKDLVKELYPREDAEREFRAVHRRIDGQEHRLRVVEQGS